MSHQLNKTIPQWRQYWMNYKLNTKQANNIFPWAPTFDEAQPLRKDVIGLGNDHDLATVESDRNVGLTTHVKQRWNTRIRIECHTICWLSCRLLADLPTLKSLEPEHLFMLCAWNSGVHPQELKKLDCKWCHQSYSGALFVTFCFRIRSNSGFSGAGGSYVLAVIPSICCNALHLLSPSIDSNVPFLPPKIINISILSNIVT